MQKVFPKALNSKLIKKILDVNSKNYYYPFGMLMSERSYSSPAYRFGFNSMEKTDEVIDAGNEYSTTYRQLDVRLGKWFSVDELEQNYPGNSSYSFVRNCPIILTDVTGLGDQPTNKKPVKEDVKKAEVEGKAEGTIKPISPATPKVNPDGSPNKDAYNCHSYAWENCQGSPKDPENQSNAQKNPKWDNNPENNTAGYIPIPFNEPNKVGDKIIYYNTDVNSNVVPTHSAIVTKVDKDGNTLEVKSKWGEFGVYKHHPRDVPDSYSADGAAATSSTGQTYATRVYYRKTTTSEVKATPQSANKTATKVGTKENIHPSNKTYYKPAFIIKHK